MRTSSATASVPVAPLSILMVASLLGSAEVEGQSTELMSLQLTVGSVNGSGELPNAPILSAPNNVVSYGSLDPQVAVGLSMLLHPARTTPLGLRFGVARSLARTRTGIWGCATGACPSILIEVPTEFALSTVTADLLTDLGIGPVSVRPAAGLSYLRHSYEWDPSPVGSFSLDPGSYVDQSVALHLGIAVLVPIGPVRTSIEYFQHRGHSSATRPRRVGAWMLGVEVPVA